MALLAASSLRCSGDNIGPRTATTIEEAGGGNQAGTVGQPLTNPLVVLVTDDDGNPVENVSVSWGVQGGGSVSATAVATGSNGRASVTRVLGTQPGEQTTTASVSGLQGSPVTFVALASDANSPSLALQTQPSTAAQSGVPFPVQPVIQLKDAAGNNLAQNGTEVTAELASGSGTLGGTLTSTTDADGKASFTNLSITGAPGSYTLRFIATGMNPALSEAITLGAAAGSIVITTNPPVSALNAEVFSPVVQPVVQVRDESGNPAAGQQVTARIASGPGVLEGNATATTDAAGVAAFVDLGIKGTGDHTLEFTAGTASVTSSPVTVSALLAEATTGKWGQLVQWDIVPLHMSLMPSGKILAWGKTEISDTMGMPRIWDPAAGPPTGAQMLMTDSMLFCAGHNLMPDGRLMVSGGHLMDDRGTATTTFFSPDGAVQKGPNMAHARWYPTVTILENGRALTMGGRDQGNQVVTTPEIWENDHWVELPGAGTVEIPYYPRNFVDPKNGQIFYAGERVQSRWFDVDGTGTGGGRGRWSSGPTHKYGFNREYGSAVMYDVGKILYVGGGGHQTWRQSPDPKTDVPTATAETIDLNAASPTWQFTSSMAVPRRHMNATILPDGQVLATGGTRGGGFVNINEGLAVKQAEMWDPATGQWTTLASASTMRVYHSVSLLLPDGTVLHGSSGDAMADGGPVPPERNHEIFSPPYLFKGARPTITSAPDNVSYNQVFSVVTPNAAQVTTVRWIRLGSVTHAFDASARANTLDFDISGGNVQVTAPLSARLAPPGYYQLFILNRNGVPSVGKIIHVQ
jgi:hypothetical protein